MSADVLLYAVACGLCIVGALGIPIRVHCGYLAAACVLAAQIL